MLRIVNRGLREIARLLRVRKIFWWCRWKFLNKIYKRHQCYICNNRFRKFYPLRPNLKQISSFIQKMNIVGSDIINYGCPFCNSNDRERHLFLYFDRLKLWETLKGASVLHCAPEENISERIKTCKPRKYLMIDLYPKKPEILRVDIMHMPFSSESFDFILCNHVLEHVTDDMQALKEIYRVMKPGGRGVLQTPFSMILTKTLQDPGISSEKLRRIFYGQEDHVRLYGLDFFEKIKTFGFILKLIKHEDIATTAEARYFGMNVKEDLILVEKPQR